MAVQVENMRLLGATFTSNMRRASAGSARPGQTHPGAPIFQPFCPGVLCFLHIHQNLNAANLHMLLHVSFTQNRQSEPYPLLMILCVKQRGDLHCPRSANIKNYPLDPSILLKTLFSSATRVGLVFSVLPSRSTLTFPLVVICFL